MKFNYEKFPVLGFIHNPNLYPLHTNDVSMATFLSDVDFTTEIAEWRKPDTRIKYLTKPFQKALQETALRMVGQTVMLPKFDERGVILWGDTFFMYKPWNNGTLMIMRGEGSFVTDILVTNGRDEVIGHSTKGNGDAIVNLLIFTVYFLKHCEIETKVITERSERTMGVQRYSNQTRSNVSVINCLWFTNLISTIPHDVSGHFRWQPYGPGRTLHKLIWIADFTRNGFLKQARVLKQNNNYGR